ncbi:MAG: DUF1206 domain-containing protein [Chloroflexia bacterium]
MSAIDATKKGGKEAAEKIANSSWIEWLARFGYLVRGVLYLLVGVLAIQVAIGARRAAEGAEGAIATLSPEPFGKILLVGVVVGLAGYSLWGFVRAALDPMGKGSSLKGIAQRIGYVISALTYGALIIPTIRAIVGYAEEQENGTEQGTAFLLSQPLGHWLVLLAGLIAMGGAVGQAYLGITGKFKDDFKQSEMSAKELKISTWVGRAGYIARAVVFLLGGFFLVQAALQSNPEQAQGLDGALAALAQGSFGMPVLAIVALGLAAFGVYSILCTRWIKLAKHES